jgi:hypothetical protein
MLIDDRNVVALPERVKLSPEREQDVYWLMGSRAPVDG